MNDTAKQEGRKMESYDYKVDFQLLTSNEKRGILKNAQSLLMIQKESKALITGTFLEQKEEETI